MLSGSQPDIWAQKPALNTHCTKPFHKTISQLHTAGFPGFISSIFVFDRLISLSISSRPFFLYHADSIISFLSHGQIVFLLLKNSLNFFLFLLNSECLRGTRNWALGNEVPVTGHGLFYVLYSRVNYLAPSMTAQVQRNQEHCLTPPEMTGGLHLPVNQPQARTDKYCCVFQEIGKIWSSPDQLDCERLSRNLSSALEGFKSILENTSSHGCTCQPPVGTVQQHMHRCV